MELYYFYMLLFIIWCIGGIEIFCKWIYQTSVENLISLFIFSFLCGPIVFIVNSVTIFVYFYKKISVNRS